jgi:hypothetical protein
MLGSVRAAHAASLRAESAEPSAIAPLCDTPRLLCCAPVRGSALRRGPRRRSISSKTALGTVFKTALSAFLSVLQEPFNHRDHPQSDVIHSQFLVTGA